MIVDRKNPKARLSKIAELFNIGDAATFKKGSATASARIIDRSIEWQQFPYEHLISRCTLTVRFNPAKAKTSAVEMEAVVEVRKKFYDKFEKSDTITVEYAIEDPAIFLLEGE